MKIAPFATEHFYAQYEFNTPYQLCNSDCETVTVDELLTLAGIPLAQLGRLALGYTTPQGDAALRQAIAANYERVEADDVVVLGTPIEGIFLCAHALLEPGDEVIVLTPAYDALINLFEHVVGAAAVKRWSFTAVDAAWRLDLDQLRALISERTKLLVVNFPHNPTGYLPHPDWFDELLQIVSKHDLRLFADEMYAGLLHSGTSPIPSAAEVSDAAVVLGGLSKTVGLPGLRSGWLIVRDHKLRDEIINWKFYTSICPPAPSEFLALAALGAGAQLLARSVAQIEANLALATAFFARWPDLFVWRRPLAGSTALVTMNVPSVSEYAARMAATAGVLIQPGTMLGAGDDSMRMGFGRKNFGEALVRFEAYLRSESGRA